MIDLIVENNKLKILLILEDRDELIDLIERDREIFCSDVLDVSRHLGNGWEDVTYQIGLTEAPAIRMDCERVFYYPDYMLTDWLQVLLEKGEVFFNEIQ